jgi:serine/threonine-protein kinase HipA
MQSAKVYRNEIYVGLLNKLSANDYRFQYDTSYLNIENIKAFSLNFPLQKEEFKSKYIFAFFFNMLAEGSMKDLQCQELKIDKDDDFSRLLKTAKENTIGSITIKEDTNE